ncbi:MAG: hypothetical protein ACKVJK_03775 [Methylophagaceae bacterium]|jgi:hypothetical protein|tara:strand:- start:7808 stop:8035 length:228 start_codon:yes stop_codon:yes gene_type:complete
MEVEQAIDVWNLFKEYVDKKQVELVAEKFVDLLADHGFDDQQIKEISGFDNHLDEAISYYLDEDVETYDDEEEDF